MVETADVIVSLVMAGMGAAFVVGDPRRQTSRALLATISARRR